MGGMGEMKHRVSGMLKILYHQHNLGYNIRLEGEYHAGI